MSREEVPAGFQFPSEGAYATTMVRAVASLSADSIAGGDYQTHLLTPPVAAQVRALSATLEHASGLSLGQLAGAASSVAALASATSPAEIVRAVSGLVMGTLSMAASVLRTAGVSINTVPVLGQLIGALTLFISEVLASQARYKSYGDECQQRAVTNRDRFCAQLVASSMPKPTGEPAALNPSGLEPSDLFRPLAYQWLSGGRNYPANLSSIYLGTCGGEAGRLSLWTPERYRAVCKGLSVPPIKQTTQRKMWALVRALMSGARDPRPFGADVLVKSDGGRALLPILQDLINGERQRGTLPRRMLQAMSDRALEWTDYYIRCPELPAGEIGAGAMPTGGASCRGERIDLVGPFIAGLDQFDRAMRRAFLRGGVWTHEPAVDPRLVLAAKFRGVLVIPKEWYQTWVVVGEVRSWNGWLYSDPQTAGQLARALEPAGVIRFEVLDQDGLAIATRGA